MCLCVVFKELNQFKPNVAFHLKNSHVICRANQMTGFYMKCNTGLKWLNQFIGEKMEECCIVTQLAITCSKLTIETLGQGVK